MLDPYNTQLVASRAKDTQTRQRVSEFQLQFDFTTLFLSPVIPCANDEPSGISGSLPLTSPEPVFAVVMGCWLSFFRPQYYYYCS